MHHIQMWILTDFLLTAGSDQAHTFQDNMRGRGTHSSGSLQHVHSAALVFKTDFDEHNCHEHMAVEHRNQIAM
jgi:hypothetical protein